MSSLPLRISYCVRSRVARVQTLDRRLGRAQGVGSMARLGRLFGGTPYTIPANF